jgi:hypothetical protein
VKGGKKKERMKENLSLKLTKFCARHIEKVLELLEAQDEFW